MVYFFFTAVSYLIYYNTFQKRFADYKKNLFKKVEN